MVLVFGFYMKTPSVLWTSLPLWGEAVQMVSPSIEGGVRGGSVGVRDGPVFLFFLRNYNSIMTTQVHKGKKP